MRKILFGICLCSIAGLTGCGNVIFNNISEEITLVSNDQLEDDLQSEWEEVPEINQVEQVFYSSDQVLRTNEGLIWEKSDAKAEVYENTGEYYLSYESKIVHLENVKLDISPKIPIEMRFYETDLNSDGEIELMITYTRATGTGSKQVAMECMDLSKSTEVSLFDCTDKMTKFTASQKKQIADCLSRWNQNGFGEKTGNSIDEKDFYTSLFVPSLVILDQKVFVKVDFNVSGMLSDLSLSTHAFSALFSMNDSELRLEKMWYNTF